MQIGVATFITDEGIGPADLGRALEERDFDSLVVTEHSHIPASRESPYPAGGELPRIYYRTLDPFVALTAAAVVTTRLQVATGVALVIQRDVIHTAKEVASLDLVSGGRFLFGVGAGWNLEEMRNHGTDPATRGRRLDENLAALKRIWSEEKAEFHGEHVDFDPMFAWPKPVRRPPIYIGGGSRAALRRVIEHGDGWLALGVPPEQVARTKRHFADQGRADAKIAFFGAPPTAEAIAGYREAGVDHLTLMLPTRPRDKTLSTLDDFAKLKLTA
ncbi:LLM class F420-dependent oxidoreductase [Kutzneria sp. NPDC052558]|uniref:LLM class F420-dependent oxidoreductase n=1 Tax=Kutzneria sp. NPDC052558 TaxID=3364121 RepID=UPI0037C9C6E2